jgi:hypothetical protein
MDSSIRSHHVWESHVPARSGSLNFHQVVPNLVLKTVGIVYRVRRTFEAFDDSDRDLAQFVEPRVFPRCDQFLVPWSCGIAHKLAWPNIWRPWSSWVVWVPSPSRCSGLPQIAPNYVLFGHATHGLTTHAGEAVGYEVFNADWVMRPTQSISD